MALRPRTSPAPPGLGTTARPTTPGRKRSSLISQASSSGGKEIPSKQLEDDEDEEIGLEKTDLPLPPKNLNALRGVRREDDEDDEEPCEYKAIGTKIPDPGSVVGWGIGESALGSGKEWEKGEKKEWKLKGKWI